MEGDWYRYIQACGQNESGAEYLPVYDEFRQRMNSGEVEEYRGEAARSSAGVASIERGESESNFFLLLA